MKIAILLVLLLAVLAFARNSEYKERNREYKERNREYRTFDGSFNNEDHPSWGKTFTAKLRRVNKYDDGISIPYGGQPSRLPSPRLISNAIFNRPIVRYLAKQTTTALTFFGQFIDHDIALTDIPNGASCDPFPIPIPTGDPIFDPLSVGGRTMSFCKSLNVSGTGTGPSNPREFPNQDTGYLDASQIYGSDLATANAIRSFQGGLFKTTDGPDGELLPINVAANGVDVLVQDIANENANIPTTQLYAGGESRVNENAMLTSYHTLWMREHNRRARLLAKKHPKWNDEKLFQEARRWTVALFQHIVVDEYLPTVLGERLPHYRGYNCSVQSQADLFFTTAFFRYGHDQLPTEIDRIDADGRILPVGNLLLRDAFFNPSLVTKYGIGPYLRGAVTAYQFKMDAIVVDDVRDFLFHLGSDQATDLVARNIQRAREFGLGSYNDARVAYGLPPCSTYQCITTEPEALAGLTAAYGPNGINDVDIFVGALLEPKRPNSLFVGDLLYAGFVDQFTRFRDGDRFWFERHGYFKRKELEEIRATTFGDIIQRNTDSKNIPKYAFKKDQSTAFEILSLATEKTSDFKPGYPLPKEEHDHHDDDDEYRRHDKRNEVPQASAINILSSKKKN